MTTPQPSDEWQRLSTAVSLSDIVGRTITDFKPLPVCDVLPCDSVTFKLPQGWYLAASGDTEEPVRAAVTGHRTRGGWQGCDTLAAFGLTGTTPATVATKHASCTLRDLGASGVTTRSLDIPMLSGAWAVRSSGYFTAAGLRMWAQFSTYFSGSNEPGRGRLIQHSMFVTTQSHTQLRADITDLSNAVHMSSARCSGPAPTRVEGRYEARQNDCARTYYESLSPAS